MEPVKVKVSCKFDIDHNVTGFDIYYENTKEKKNLPLENIKFKSIIEIKIPLSALELPKDYDNIEFTLSVDKDSMEVERWPYQSSVVMPKPIKNFNVLSWTV